MTLEAGPLRVLLILTIGSLAAPIVYIVLGYVSPGGFHDLRNAGYSAVAATFAGAWFFSFLLTLICGGLIWWPLHIKRFDGFISYVVVAALCSVGVYLASSFPNFSLAAALILVSLAVANALSVRAVELLFPAKHTT